MSENNENTPLIFELSRPGRRAFRLPDLDVPKRPLNDLLPEKFIRKTPAALPEIDTQQVVRHYTRLSKKNFGLDDAFYPLGSCTMKYNPRINERVAALPGFAQVHPYQPEETVQGMLQLLYELQEYLKDLSGLAAVSLMPAAGAHGELTSLMLIKAYHRQQQRNPSIILVPDVAHGTNPASSTLCGFKPKTVRSSTEGLLDLEDLAKNLSEDVAAIMITNPNTLGLFEKDIAKVCNMLHEVGGLVYMDGANMNALLGIAKPADFGIDVMHYNLHKTFSTPHGGGGPGAGPIAVAKKLADFLPGCVFNKDGEHYSSAIMPKSIGRTRGFFGNVGVMVRAYAYIREMGENGLSQIARMAVLNANYIRKSLQDIYELPYRRVCMHEVVLSASGQKKNNHVRALDIAKGLLDKHIHPPTVYFPLTVQEAMMIEPTETENKETLDMFIRAMEQIAKDAQERPQVLQNAPVSLSVKRLDEVTAARKPVLRWTPKNHKE